MNTKIRFQKWFWIHLGILLLCLERRGWKKPRQAMRIPLLVLELDNLPGSNQRRGPKTGQDAPIFGTCFRLKVKLWLIAIRFSVGLKRRIERRAAKSVGLIGGGAMLVYRDGEILNSYLKTLENSTHFFAN